MIITEKVKFRGKEINVSDLSVGSHIEVEVICDICRKHYKMEYRRYMSYIQKGEICTCVKCKTVKIDKTNLERYGCKNVFENDDIKLKSKNTIMDRYNVDNVSKSREIKNKKIETNRKHWGTDWGLSSPIVIEKRNNTNIVKYDCENVFQCEGVKNKIKITNLQRYGCENPLNNEFVKEKMMQSRFRSLRKENKYKNTDLYYQSSYEKDFLDNFYNYFQIERGFSIDYKLNDKIRKYYPDFYLPQYNLIIEIKSKIWYELDINKNLEKQKSCLNRGHKFLFIIDKNYSEFKIFLDCYKG